MNQIRNDVSRTDNISRLVRIGEAAEMLGISVDTLRRWEKKGLIKSRRTKGGQRRYSRQQLDELMGSKQMVRVGLRKGVMDDRLQNEDGFPMQTIHHEINSERHDVNNEMHEVRGKREDFNNNRQEIAGGTGYVSWTGPSEESRDINVGGTGPQMSRAWPLNSLNAWMKSVVVGAVGLSLLLSLGYLKSLMGDYMGLVRQEDSYQGGVLGVTDKPYIIAMNVPTELRKGVVVKGDLELRDNLVLNGLIAWGENDYQIDSDGNAVLNIITAGEVSITGELRARQITATGYGGEGMTLSGSTVTLQSEGELSLMPNIDIDDYIYLSTTSNQPGVFFEGTAATYDPGLRMNASTGKLEYRDENTDTWTPLDDLEDSVSYTSLWTDGGDYLYPASSEGLRVGSGTPGTVDGGGDVYITDDLEVDGTIYAAAFKLPTGAQTGYVLTTDFGGNASWVDGGSAVSPWTLSGDDLYADSTSYNVGIGITSPLGKLHIAEGSLILDTAGAGSFKSGTDPLYITRSGGIDQAIKISVDDNAAIFETVQDETDSTYGSVRFVLDNDGTANPLFQVTTKSRHNGGVNPSSNNTMMTMTGDGLVSLGLSYTDTLAAFDLQNSVTASSGVGYGTRVAQTLTAAADNDVLYGMYIDPNYVDGIYTGVDHYGLIVADGNVGIGTTGPGAKLHVQNGALLFDGTTGSTPVSGTGTRMMWIPDKGAFRAGRAYSTDWDSTNIGSYSFAAGNYVLASGVYSVAMGVSSEATGERSVGIGHYAYASGAKAVAIGSDPDASGEQSLALGTGAATDGLRSVAIGGYYPYAEGDYSFAAGYYSYAAGNYSTVIGGANNTASGDYSFAVGRRAKATADGSFSIADSTNADFTVGTTDVFGARFNGGYWLTGGNVGIGTTSPSAHFEVDKSNAIIRSTDTTQNYNVDLYASDLGPRIHLGDLDSASDSFMSIGVWSGYNNLNTKTRDFRIYSTAVSDGVIFEQDTGNVGIGTTGPGAKLDVSGNIYPSTDGSHNLGSASYRWNAGWIQALFAGNGGVSAPSISFKNDTDTGLFYPGTDRIGFVTGATERMRIDNSGNVGIGTTSPDAKIHVVHAAGISSKFQRVSEDTSGSATVWQKARGSVGSEAIVQDNDVLGGFFGRGYSGSAFVDAAAIRFKVDGTPGVGADMPGRIEFETSPDGTSTLVARMIIQNDGNVGIGTTTPYGLLDVGGAATGQALVQLNELGDQDIFTASSSGTTRMVIANDGNVGIGTTSPAYKLHVSGVIIGTDTVYATGGGAELKVTQVGTSTNTGQFKVGNFSSGYLSLYSNNTEYLTINISGNVGIGSTDPTAELDVAGTASVSALTIRGSSPGYIDQLNGNDLIFRTSPGGDIGLTEAMTILNNGNVGIGTTNPTGRLVVTGDGSNNIFEARSSSGSLRFALGSEGNAFFYNGTYFEHNVRLKDDAVLRFGGGDDYSIGYNSADDTFRFADGSDLTTMPRLTMNSSGNIGIGTTGPLGLLNVSGAATGQALMQLDELGDQDIFTASSSGTTRFVIDNGGNVGLGGVTSPQARLDLGSAGKRGGWTDLLIPVTTGERAQIEFYDTTSSGYIGFNDTDTEGISIYTGGLYEQLLINPTGVIINDDSYDLDFRIESNGDSGAFFLEGSSGNVGIGTTSPGSLLYVTDDVATDYVAEFYNDGNNVNRYGVMVQAGLDDQSAAGPSTLVQFNDGDGTDVGSITFGSSLTAYNTSSDVRLKDNIELTGMGIEELMSVKVRDFTFRADESGRVHTGFVAQELYGIYPDAVTAFSDDRYWQVDYGKVTPLIIASIQEQQMEMQEVRSKMQEFNVELTEQGDVDLDQLSQRLIILEHRLETIEYNQQQPQDLLSMDEVMNEIATISATLTNDIDNLSINQLLLRDDVDLLMGDVLGATDSASLPLHLPLGQGESSSSAVQALLELGDSLTSTEATISALTVTQKTLLNEVGITGNISNGLLIIDGLNTNISTIGFEPLRLQTNSLAGVEFVGGKAVMDVNGNLTVNEVTVDKVNVVRDGEADSMGQVVVSAGETSVVVETEAVGVDSLIFVSANAPVNVGVEVVSEGVFEVRLGEGYTEDVRVNWWVIN